MQQKSLESFQCVFDIKCTLDDVTKDLRKSYRLYTRTCRQSYRITFVEKKPKLVLKFLDGVLPNLDLL